MKEGRSLEERKDRGRERCPERPGRPAGGARPEPGSQGAGRAPRRRPSPVGQCAARGLLTFLLATSAEEKEIGEIEFRNYVRCT